MISIKDSQIQSELQHAKKKIRETGWGRKIRFQEWELRFREGAAVSVSLCIPYTIGDETETQYYTVAM